MVSRFSAPRRPAQLHFFRPPAPATMPLCCRLTNKTEKTYQRRPTTHTLPPPFQSTTFHSQLATALLHEAFLELLAARHLFRMQSQRDD